MEAIQLNWLDYIIVGLVLLSTVGGAIRGLLKEILPLVSLVLGLFVAYRVSPELQPYALDWWSSETMAYVFCFAASFVLAWIILGLLGGLLYRIVKASAAGPIDKLLGMILGLVRGVAVAVVVVLVLLASLPPEHEALRESVLAPKVLYVGRFAVSFMPEDAKRELLKRYDDLKRRSGDLRRAAGRFHPDSV